MAQICLKPEFGRSGKSRGAEGGGVTWGLRLSPASLRIVGDSDLGTASLQASDGAHSDLPRFAEHRRQDIAVDARFAIWFMIAHKLLTVVYAPEEVGQPWLMRQARHGVGGQDQ